MGSRSLFPVVAVPLAFFCTLFFRHRKKSVSAPWDGQSQSAPESARQSPIKGEFFTSKLSIIAASRGLSARPLHPFGSPPEAIERLIGLHALPSRRSRRVRPHQREISTAKLLPMMQTGGFPRGKPSAQPALPCAPLTVCLTSSAPEPAHPPPRGSAPAHSRISFLRSQNSAPERKGNAHALFCRW